MAENATERLVLFDLRRALANAWVKLDRRWKRAGQLFLEIVVAAFISSYLHPEEGSILKGEHALTLPSPRYLITLVLLVIAEHAIVRVLKEWQFSGNWEAIQELVEGDRKVPPESAKVMIKAMGREDLTRKVRDGLHLFLTDLSVPRYAEEVFVRRLKTTKDEIAALKDQRGFSSNKYIQFELAAGLAERFKDELKTVYATTLDPPGDFFTDYGRLYFDVQERLPNIEKQRFVELATPEIKQLETLLKGGSHTLVPDRECPAKARIVVASLDDLTSELQRESINDDFKEFNKWHLNECFGLRYFILDGYKIGQKERHEAYLEHIRTSTGANSEDEIIGDFIVYNGNVVFGRTGTNWKNQDRAREQVKIRMLHTQELSDPYNNVFMRFWQRAVPLCSLWDRLKREHKVNQDQLDAMKETADFLVRFFYHKHPKHPRG